MVRPNRRWKMCVQQAAATGQKEGKTSGQRKKQTNHSRTNADVAVAATAAAAADVAVAVSKCRRAPIHRQWGRHRKRECKLCIIYGNQFRVNINTVATQRDTKPGQKQNAKMAKKKRRNCGSSNSKCNSNGNCMPSVYRMPLSTYLVLLKCLLSSIRNECDCQRCNVNWLRIESDRLGLSDVAFWSQNCSWSRATKTL